MNKNKLKAYAPAARREFIQAVTDRANLMGLSEGAVEQAELRGDVLLIAGRAYPKEVYPQRQALEARVAREGFRQVIEEAAYSWFNRFTALRYMELHGYLDHGLRVLSNPSGSHIPEVLEKATQVELPGLRRERVVELKLAGDKDAELYRMLLVAQCNQLHAAMPFLFERINDATELLLPDNLLHSDSLIRRLVTGIDEADWQEVEIIGWLYQFYISERKDEVIGRVVKSEDIPAATQLFTPNWIVKYMVQNSVGRMWLQTYPASALKGKMEYYIEPAAQSDEVEAQLKLITPEVIDPEGVTVLDPACGSGHILVEAYDVLKEIYQERGYRQRDIARLILEKNLYGLDIDERAAQLAGFALLMKARGDDRRILEDAPRLNVLAIAESAGVKAEELAGALLQVRSQPRAVPMVGGDNLWGDVSRQGALMVAAAAVETAGAAAAGVSREEIVDLLELFREGKTLGSLISVPDEMARRLPAIRGIVEENLNSGELYAREAASALLPFVRQAEVLAGKYDCVIANPPYMGNKYLNSQLKQYLKRNFAGYEKDLFSSFIVHNLRLTKAHGQLGFMSPFVWMFISSYEKLREKLIDAHTLTTLIQLEYSGFAEATVPVCTFTLYRQHLRGFTGSYIRLSDFRGAQNQAPKTLESIRNPACSWFYNAKQDDFKKIPGRPIAYWVSDSIRSAFLNFPSLATLGFPRQGNTTTDNARFVRSWFEVDGSRISYSCANSKELDVARTKWVPYNKGGGSRKWYGLNESLVNWEDNGREIKAIPHSVVANERLYFGDGLTWSTVKTVKCGFRYFGQGFIFDNKGACLFTDKSNIEYFCSLLNSDVFMHILGYINPSIAMQPGDVGKMPIVEIDVSRSVVEEIARQAIRISKNDWDSFETSWDFQELPLLRSDLKASTVEESFNNWQTHCNANIRRMQELETENNRLFIEAYNLQDELTPEVPEDQITLARANAETDTRRLVSYATGCMMGRYSLDKHGIIYTDSANIGFDPSNYQTFAADADGIIPVTDLDWFTDDACNRFVEFLRVAWSLDTTEENLRFVAAKLTPKQNEQPRDTIRRYFSTGFFKDHLQTYKKRPIYWLFSSGKQKAFECLVYLHRYTPSTLSRMRNEYVTPLFGKLSGQIEYVTGELNPKDITDITTSARNKLQKQLDALKKKLVELQAFDAELRHYADQRIALDLDDGVKVNYGKFGNLLADSKTIAAESE